MRRRDYPLAHGWPRTERGRDADAHRGIRVDQLLAAGVCKEQLARRENPLRCRPTARRRLDDMDAARLGKYRRMQARSSSYGVGVNMNDALPGVTAIAVPRFRNFACDAVEGGQAFASIGITARSDVLPDESICAHIASLKKKARFLESDLASVIGALDLYRQAADAAPVLRPECKTGSTRSTSGRAQVAATGCGTDQGRMAAYGRNLQAQGELMNCPFRRSPLRKTGGYAPTVPRWQLRLPLGVENACTVYVGVRRLSEDSASRDSAAPALAGYRLEESVRCRQMPSTRHDCSRWILSRTARQHVHPIVRWTCVELRPRWAIVYVLYSHDKAAMRGRRGGGHGNVGAPRVPPIRTGDQTARIPLRGVLAVRVGKFPPASSASVARAC